MPNWLRVIVASFLVKDLLIPWQPEQVAQLMILNEREPFAGRR